jgi:signal transduction histidine kinase
MNYQIILDQKEVFSGDLYLLGVIALVLLVVFLFIFQMIWRKLRSYENLKYEFVTIIAHKFRTPLTQIKWILESVLAGETDSFKRESLANIGQSTKTLISLTNTLVELNHSTNKSVTTYSFERLNICDLVSKTADTLKERFHEKNIFFGIECSEPDIFAKVDRSRIEFVIQTIIENSINYSPVGMEVKIFVQKIGHKVKITVVDHGIGIASSDMSRIFTKFFRSKNAQTMDTEGFGVGLYLAQSIVKRHKGKMEVFSEGVNMGSSFSVILKAVK